MTPRHVIAPLVPVIVLVALALQCCIAAAVGGGATLGVAAAQERSLADAVDDVAIYAAVNQRLLQKDLDLYASIGIEVIEARVLLTGTVRKPEHRVEAVRLAWQAEGVKEVINEVQVTDKDGITDYARDAWISTQLKTKLMFDKKISAINYNVETVNRIVYIIGIAQDKDELSRATNHARTIPHVRKVVSHVRLKDTPTT